MDEFIYVSMFDPGPAGWRCDSDVTLRERGMLRPHRLIRIPGEKNEHELFARSPTGRLTKRQWSAFLRSVADSGIKSTVAVHVSRTRHARIFEGNHRIRAAALTGHLVPTEISYFCDAYLTGLVAPEVPRIQLPPSVQEYVVLSYAVRFASGRKRAEKRNEAALAYLQLRPEDQVLAAAVNRVEGNGDI